MFIRKLRIWSVRYPDGRLGDQRMLEAEGMGWGGVMVVMVLVGDDPPEGPVFVLG